MHCTFTVKNFFSFPFLRLDGLFKCAIQRSFQKFGIKAFLGFALTAFSIFSSFGQSSVTIAGPASPGNTNRAPIERNFNVTSIQHHWSNLLLIDSILNTFGFPDFVWIDSIAFFKSSTSHPSQPFAFGMWLGQANSNPNNYTANSWDNIVLDKRTVLIDSAFRLDTTRGEVVFRFQTPYAYWNNGLEIASRSDFGPVPSPPLSGNSGLHWLSVNGGLFELRSTGYRSPSNSFNSWEVGEVHAAFTFPIVKIYYRSRIARDLGIKSLLSPIFPIIQDSTSTVKVKVQNEGITTLTAAELSYQINQGTVVTQSFPLSLPPDSSIDLSFSTPFQIPAENEFNIRVWINHVNNGMIDSVSNNNAFQELIRTAITADTVFVGQQHGFTNLQQVFTRLTHGGNTKPLTVILTENQAGNFTLSNFSAPENRRVTIRGMNITISIQSGNRGPLLHFQNVEGVTVLGLQLQHNAVVDSSDHLFLAMQCKRIEIVSNRMLGSHANSGNFLVLLRNCDHITLRGNHFVNGSRALVSISDQWNKGILQHQILSNQFNNQTFRAIQYYGSSISDSILIASNLIHNTVMPLVTAQGIEIYHAKRINIHSNSVTGFIGSYGIHLRLFIGSASQPNQVVNNVISGNFGSVAGSALFLQSDGISPNFQLNFVNVYHNSLQVKLNATPSNGLAPLRLSNRISNINLWGGFNIRNNLMLLNAPASTTGSAAIIVGSMADLTGTNMVLSHNHYHVPGHSQVRTSGNTENFTTLAAWRAAYPNSELNSSAGDPLLISPVIDNLRPALNSPLVNSGIPIANIPLDRDGNIRDLLPDRGAFEAQPLTNSSHLLRIATPSPNTILLADSHYTLSVWLRNTGTNTINSLRFSHRFGTRDTVNVVWNGSLVPGDSMLFSFPQTIRIPSNSVFMPDLRVWTSTLGGTSSPNALLDTLIGLYCMRIPAGTYQIGQQGDSVSPLLSWIRVLNCGGISGPVMLQTNFSANVLQNQIIELGNIPGTTANNRLTLDGQGDTLRMTSTSTQAATLRLTGTKHLSIRNFVFDGTGSNVFSQVWMQNVDTVSIVNNSFRMAPSPTLNRSIFLSGLSSGEQASRSTALRIDSNRFLGGMELAIHLVGNTTLPSRRLQIRHNFVRSSRIGFQISVMDSGSISHNDIAIDFGVSTLSRAIDIGTVSGQSHINNNRIRNIISSSSTPFNESVGIFLNNAVQSGSRTFIYNNLIYGLGSTGNHYGIFVGAGITGDIVFNTIHLSDTFSTGTCFGINLAGPITGCNIRSNNISINKQRGTNVGALWLSGNPASTNFNNYFVRHSSLQHQVIRRTVTGYATLSAYRQAFPQFDSLSTDVDPFFENVASEQFSPQAIALYRSAQALSYVPTDFNNRPRPATPSRGAIEDSIIAREIKITAFRSFDTRQCQLQGAASELATIFNLGTATADSVVIWYKRNQSAWVRDTALLSLPGRQQFSYILGRGLLLIAANDTLRAAAVAYYGSNIIGDSLQVISPTNFQPAFMVPSLQTFDNAASLNSLCITQQAQSLVQFVGASSQFALIGQGSLAMTGTNNSTNWTAVDASTAWSTNTDYLSEVTLFANPARVGPLRLAMRLRLFGSSNQAFFRLLVNDVAVTPQGSNTPTLVPVNSAQRSLLYVLDSLNTGVPLKITLQTSIRHGIGFNPHHAAIIDSLALFFGPAINISGLSRFPDTLCLPSSRQIQVQASPSIGHSLGSMSLSYAGDAGVWTTIPMTTSTPAHTYTATIPIIANTQRVRYVAVASTGTQNLTSDTADYYYFPFDVDLGPNRTVLLGQPTTLKPKIINAGIKTLRLTEFICYRAGSTIQSSFPTGVGSQDDMIEIANYGDEPVNLADVELSMTGGFLASATYQFPRGAVLQPKQRAIVTIGSTGINDFVNGIYAYITPPSTTQIFLSSAVGAIVLRDVRSKQVVDGVVFNATAFPSQMGFPTGVWTGLLTPNNSSGFKRTDVNAWSDLAWTLNTISSPSNIGTIDTTFKVGPMSSQIRWRDANGQLIGTGDSLVVTPTANTFIRVEADWYGCTRPDLITLTIGQNNIVDLAITAIIQPPAIDTIALTTGFAPAVRVKNLGNLPSGSTQVELLANGSIVASANLPQGLGGNDSALVSLSDWLPLQGTYNLCFRLINTADSNPANNVLCRNNIYFAVSTSVPELALNDIRIYPVPTKDQLFVELGTAHGNIDHWQWQAVDAAGRIIPLMLLSAPENDRVELDIRPLSNGIYFLQHASMPMVKRAKFVVIH